MRNRKRSHIELGARNAKVMRILIGCVVACLLFCGGFMLRGDRELMTRLGMEPSEATTAASTGLSASANELASRLSEIEGILENESLDSFDMQVSTDAVTEAFLESTNDSFTRYYSDARYSSYVDSTNGNYPGVGVFFAEYEGRAYALDVFEGSPAAEAGVKPGDFVVAIDGDRSQEWSAVEAINAVQREEGSSVVVTWHRSQGADETTGSEFTTTLTCSDYAEPNVSTSIRDGVGYIRLTQFTQNSDSLVRAAIEELTKEGAASFVLDLRDNPGGYLTKAVDVASLFIKSGVVVAIETVEANTTKQASGDVATDAPMVVLVNEDTAGAAEVLAAALRDTGRATLVGTTTMGKGSVQVIKPLSFGGALRYTAARYKSPDGYSIDGLGVSPDVSVALREGSQGDNQLDVAVDTAASLPRS